MKLLKSGFTCCWYMVCPVLSFANDFLLRFAAYKQVNALAVQLKTMSETSVVIPLSLSSVAVESAVQMIGNAIAYCMWIVLKPYAKLVSFISRGIFNFVQRITGVDARKLSCGDKPCYMMDYIFKSTVTIASYILNGLMMLIFFLIVLTMMFTLLLTPFVPLVLIVSIVITMLIALSLIAVISQMTKTISNAFTTIKKTIGVILLISTGGVSMVLACITSCAVVLCWIFIISSMQIICFTVSAFMIASLFITILILTIIGKAIETDVKETPNDNTKLSLTFSKT